MTESTKGNECSCGRDFNTREELGEHLIWWVLDK